jgi:leader peptidase (prepilin peptidase) / N-methyltransferase
MAFFDLLQASPPAFIALFAALGLTVGSFLNVVIYRLPKMMEREWVEQCAALNRKDSEEEPAPTPPYNLVIPRSACPSCGHLIRAWENIPVLSYLALRGKCAHCGAHISARYPVVEAITGCLSGFAAWHFGYGMTACAALILVWALVALTFIDFDTQLLPDDITLPLLWLGLLFNIGNTFTDLASAVIGAVAGYLSLWSVYWMFKLIMKKEGMGYGDFKLLAAIGAWFGWIMLPLVILLSSAVGAVVGIFLMVLAKRGRNVPMPFGPYLAGGALVALFWGQPIVQAYLGL